MPPKNPPRKAIAESSGEEFEEPGSDSDSEGEFSGEEVSNDPWEFPVVEAGAKRPAYKKALRDAQLKVGELQLTVRKLHMQVADLTTQLKKAQNSKSEKSSTGTKSKTRETLSDADKRVAQAAKMFGVMNEGFVPQAALLVPKPATNSMSPTRYDSDLSRQHGITAELYEALPHDMHRDLEKSPAFRTLFLGQLNAARRTMISQFRSTTAHKIFSLPGKYYATSFDRATIPAFQNKLKYPGDRNYTKFPPILFPGGIRNMKEIFKNIELPLMLRSVLFGPTSLDPNVKAPSSATQGKVWGLTFVTPGAIALMSIIAIYLHSPDTEFAPVGKNSHIPYGKWFDHFKQFLMKNADTAEIQKLFKWWNGRVFNVTGASEESRKDDAGDSSGMEEAEAALNKSGGNHSDGNDNELIEQFQDLAVTTPSWGASLRLERSDPPSIPTNLPLNAGQRTALPAAAPATGSEMQTTTPTTTDHTMFRFGRDENPILQPGLKTKSRTKKKATTSTASARSDGGGRVLRARKP